MRKDPIIFIFGAMLLIASCDKSPDRENVSLRLSPRASVEVVSRADIITGETFPGTRSICASAYHNAAQGQGTSAEYFTGKTFVKGEGGTWEGSAYWPATGSLDILCYSAADDRHLSNVRWGTPSASSISLTLDTVEDLLVGYRAQTSRTDSGIVDMTFRHALSMLRFRAYTDEPYDETLGRGIVLDKVTVNGVKSKGMMTATASTNLDFFWSNPSSPQEWYLCTESVVLNNTTRERAKDVGTPMLAIPQEATTVTVSFSAHNGDGIVIPFTFTASLGEELQWKAGVCYTYYLHIGLKSLSIDTTVVEWTDGEKEVEFKR